MAPSQHLKANSGLEAYDHAVWSDWVPMYDNIWSDPAGLSVLTQRADPLQKKTNEVSVTTIPQTVVLLYPAHGLRRMEYSVDNRRYLSDIGFENGIVLPKGSSSWFVGNRVVVDNTLHLHFSAGLIERALAALGISRADTFSMAGPFRDPLMAGLGAWLAKSLAEAKDMPPLFWDTLAHSLAIRLAELARRTRTTPPGSGGLAPWQLRRVTDRMNDMLSGAVRLEELASLCGLSVFHFARSFKVSTGTPPHSYLINLRMDRAKRLLIDTDMPMIHVALSLGYDSSQSFARAFRQSVGCTPSEWRRQRLD